MTQNDFRPLSFWSFNGDMAAEEIQTQIRQMKEQGYGGFYMHARAGMTLEYLGDAWFSACRVAVKEAKAQGMTAWLYDENGWPSGFAGGAVPALGEACKAKFLHFVQTPAEAGEDRVMAAFEPAEDGTYRLVPEKASAKATLYACVGKLEGYADLLNPQAVQAFIRFTHERYAEELGEYFGTVIPGIFTDEPQLLPPFPFTEALPELYRARYGEDFWEQAWRLQADGTVGAAFKYRACKLVAELFRTSFTEQIEAWCKAHHLIFTGHFSNEDGLCNRITANYDLAAHYAVMSRPGIDFLGRRLTSPVLVKQVSDTAYLNGKSRITSESFGCCGWDVPFNDLLWIAEWQAAFGINSIVTHLSAYSMKGRRKRDYPAFFSYQEPWWEKFHTVSERITQVNAFLSEGKRRIALLAVVPTTGMWCTLSGREAYTDEARLISAEFRRLVENLLDLQKDFLLVTEEELRRFTLSDRALCRGDMAVSTVLVADTPCLEAATCDLLQNLAAQGGNVVFINRRPMLCEGVLDRRADEIAAAVVDNRRGLLEKYFLSAGQTEEIAVVEEFSGKTAEGLILSFRHLPEEKRVFVINPSRTAGREVYLKAVGCVHADGLSGVYDGTYTYFPFSLAPTQSLQTVIRQTGTAQTSALVSPTRTAVLTVEKVERLSPNALTVERCDIYLNGALLAADANPVCCVDRLYEQAYHAAARSEVCLVYRFTADFSGDIPQDICLAAETEQYTAVQVNGQELLSAASGWWLDKSIRTYPIAACVHNGANEVVLRFTITRPTEIEEQGEFEGYRNRFFYPIEPESIYITGDFDVKASGQVTEGMDTLHVAGTFALTDATEKTAGEWTAQNLWFYRGNMRLTTHFETTAKRVQLSLKELRGTAAAVFLNRNYVGTICRAPFAIALPDSSADGENLLEIVWYGSNRNLLGPHHHTVGNPHLVGPLTFTGQRAFTDFYYPQITQEDTYKAGFAFVKTACGRLILEEI